MVDSSLMKVSVAYSPGPRQVREVPLWLCVDSTVLQAVQASGLLEEFGAIDPQSMVLGVWGRKASLNQPLCANDRVEIYRSLAVDPKLARRLRFEKQGAGVAGLFAKRNRSIGPTQD